MASTAEFDFTAQTDSILLARHILETGGDYGRVRTPSLESLSRAYLDLMGTRGLPPNPADFVCHPSIQLRSGAYYDFTNPPNILASDIAAGLRMPRFNAQTRGDLYTIAQHCVLGAEQALPHSKFLFLMHDAPESVYGDVTTPFKQLHPDLKKTMKRVDAKFAEQFHLPLKMPREIKEIDLRMAATEKRDLMPHSSEWAYLDGITPFNFSITPWSAQYAMNRWMEMFGELWPKHLDAWKSDSVRVHDQLYRQTTSFLQETQ